MPGDRLFCAAVLSTESADCSSSQFSHINQMYPLLEEKSQCLGEANESKRSKAG